MLITNSSNKGHCANKYINIHDMLHLKEVDEEKTYYCRSWMKY